MAKIEILTWDEVARLMSEHNVSQADLARLFGVAEANISRLKSGNRLVNRAQSMVLSHFFMLSEVPTVKNYKNI